MAVNTPIFVKTYDWSLWLFQKTSGFPKRFRLSLAQRMENDTLRLEDALSRAYYSRGRERRRRLDEADAVLNMLRLNARRCYDLRVLAGKSYEYAARALNEIGALLGAWKGSGSREAS